MFDPEMASGLMDLGFFGIIMYLLYERGKFNETIVGTMREICVVLQERMPDMKRNNEVIL